MHTYTRSEREKERKKEREREVDDIIDTKQVYKCVKKMKQDV